MVTYTIYHVDEGLSVALLERIGHFDRLPVREDCLDKRGELILGNCAADQLLPALLVGVDGDGCIGEMVIHKHRVRRALGKSEVSIGGQDRWLYWGTIFVGLPVTFMLG